MNWKAIPVLAAILGVFFLGFLLFAPIHDISKDMTTQFITPVTENNTSVTVDNGTIPVFNDVKAGIGGGYFWIILIVVIVAGIIAWAAAANGSEQ
jgi:hypothetical protein